MFKTRFISILALLFGLLPCMSLTAYAASVSYVDGNGTSQTVDATELESTTTSWTDGSWYIVPEGGLTISGRIAVSGTVNLILRDGAELTASEGITTTGATLNIYAQSTGTGALTATGNNGVNPNGGGSAGIGGNGVARTASGGAGGTVNIYGGTVTATGGNGAQYGGGGAGIGGGGLGFKSSGGQGGTVNIYGGTVTATGGNGAQYAGGGAGIGGGGLGYKSSGGQGGTVNIYGGTVTATGGTGGNSGGGGAGIGGGGNGYDTSAGAGGTLTLGVGVKLYNGTDNTGTVLDENDSESRNYSGSRPQNMYAEVTVAAPATKYDLTLATGSDAHGTIAFSVGGEPATQACYDDVVTVSVTPNEGYSAKDVTVRAYTSWEAASEILAGGGDNPSLVSDINVTKNEENGTWSFTMPEANVWVVVTYTKNLQDAWIQAIADQTYTGSAITPTVTVMDGETTLTLNTDYTVAYSNNVETGSATVTVTGTGNYSGTATANFTIVADKSALNTAIGEAETYYNSIKDDHTAAAAALKTAIDNAKAMQEKGDATQEEVNNALSALTTAKTTAEDAVLTETKTTLNNDITAAETYYNSIKDDHTAAANTLKDAIDAAKAVKDNADATQAEVDAAIAALASAKTTAEQTVLTETKTELNDDITAAETYYNSIKDSNPAAAATLLEAINTAKAVKDNTDATQEQVDAAIAALASAKTTAEQTALNDDITDAEAYYNSIKDSNPTAAATLLEAINAAKTVKDNADATQSEIETAAQTLTDALNAAKADVALKRVTLTIPAKSYMARIDADKRQIENAVAGVKLYSVKSVTNTEVELTAELSVIAAEMPYFIYNDNDTEVEVSIIVSSSDADNVKYDSKHFKGTLVDKTFTNEDMQQADHYVLTNGSSFVWVKDAGTLAAGKCWIELVPSSPAHARALSIVHEGETTGISTVKTTADTKDAAVYDLQGRRVMQPTKGLFIVNGKKVVIK